MTDSNRSEFLNFVAQYIEKDPEAAAHISDFVQLGLRAALSEANERAADMEVALASLAAKKYKNSDSVVYQKLTKWKSKTSLKWDWLTDILKTKIKS